MSDTGGQPEVPPTEPREAALLEALAGALAPEDTVPGPSIDAALHALAWRRADEQLAELVAGELAVGVRGGSEALAFAVGDVRLEVEVDRADGRPIVTGQVSPPGSAGVAWEGPDGGSDPSPVDATGIFVLRDVARGLVRFVVERDGQPTIRTDWVAI